MYIDVLWYIVMVQVNYPFTTCALRADQFWHSAASETTIIHYDSHKFIPLWYQNQFKNNSQQLAKTVPVAQWLQCIFTISSNSYFPILWHFICHHRHKKCLKATIFEPNNCYSSMFWSTMNSHNTTLHQRLSYITNLI